MADFTRSVMTSLAAAHVDAARLLEDPRREEKLQGLQAMFPDCSGRRIAEALDAAHGDADAAASALLSDPQVGAAASPGPPARPLPPPKPPLDDSTFERRVLEECAAATARWRRGGERAEEGPAEAAPNEAERRREKERRSTEQRLERQLRGGDGGEEGAGGESVAELQKTIEELRAELERSEAERRAAEARVEEARRLGGASVSLRSVPGSARALEAAWSLSPALQPSDRDFVALFIHNRQWNWSLWQYTRAAREGSARFEGLVPGHYDARLFLGGMSSHIGRSEPALVGPLVDVRAELSGRSRVLVSWPADVWKLPESSASSDWVGLYACETRSNKQYIAYSYAHPSGCSASFEAPRAPGSYEVRYFFGGSGFCYSGKSAPIVVPCADSIAVASRTPATVQLAWALSSRPPAPRYDWIGLFEVGADSRKYLASHYTSEGTFDVAKEAGTVAFDVAKLWPRLREGVEYEFRLFSGESKYIPLASVRVILSPKQTC